MCAGGAPRACPSRMTPMQHTPSDRLMPKRRPASDPVSKAFRLGSHRASPTSYNSTESSLSTIPGLPRTLPSSLWITRARAPPARPRVCRRAHLAPPRDNAGDTGVPEGTGGGGACRFGWARHGAPRAPGSFGYGTGGSDTPDNDFPGNAGASRGGTGRVPPDRGRDRRVPGTWPRHWRISRTWYRNPALTPFPAGTPAHIPRPVPAPALTPHRAGAPALTPYLAGARPRSPHPAPVPALSPDPAPGTGAFPGSGPGTGANASPGRGTGAYPVTWSGHRR